MRKTPVTLGVLSIIFGAIIGAMSLFNLLTQQVAKKWSVDLLKGMSALNTHHAGPDPVAMGEKMIAAMEPIRPWAYSISGGFTLFSIALVAIGIGLSQRRAWARQASLLWSALGLCFLPFVIYVQIAIILPISMALVRDFLPSGAGGAFADTMLDGMLGMQKGMAIIGTLVFYAPFPVILLFLMGRSSAKLDLNAE